MTFNKSFLFSLLVIFSYSNIYAQSDKMTDLIKQGRVQRTKGNFTEAISYFQQALKINDQSAIANYELANSYYANKELKNARKFSQIVIDKNKKYLLAAYLLNGSCLTDMGKLEEANTVFKKAAEKYTHHYLLSYNLGINYYNLKQYDKSLKYAKRSVFLKPMHASSHLLFAALNEIRGNHIKSALSYYFFLLLEPNSIRSAKALAELKSLLQTITNNDQKIAATKDPFLMTKYRLAQVDMTQKKGKWAMTQFLNKTKFFFKVVGSIHKRSPYPSVWGNIYAPLFSRLGRSKHITPFCYFVHQNTPSEKTKHWNNQKKNQKASVSFQYWMSKQLDVF